jgi:hypothetical protein
MNRRNLLGKALAIPAVTLLATKVSASPKTDWFYSLVEEIESMMEMGMYGKGRSLKNISIWDDPSVIKVGRWGFYGWNQCKIYPENHEYGVAFDAKIEQWQKKYPGITYEDFKRAIKEVEALHNG